MGCTTSSPTSSGSGIVPPSLLTSQGPAQRKSKSKLMRNPTLPMGKVATDTKPPTFSMTVSDADKLLAGKAKKSLMHSMQTVEGERRFNIGSETDRGVNKFKSFGPKTVKQFGDKVDSSTEGFGYACHKGLKPDCPNQDSWVILRPLKRYSIYGVFDGHGSDGHLISHFVRENLPELVAGEGQLEQGADMKELLTDAFQRMQAMIAYASETGMFAAKMSGTTCTLVIHDHDENKLWVAHVGDCRACLLQKDTSGSTSVVELTVDHKPNLPEERNRIEKAGGQVKNEDGVWRVLAKGKKYPGINMSRCFGDLLGHDQAGLTSEPAIRELDITGQDLQLIICSDGVWEHMDNDKVGQLAQGYLREAAMEQSAQLAKAAWDRWKEVAKEWGCEEVVDDITALCVHLQPGATDMPLATI